MTDSKKILSGLAIGIAIHVVGVIGAYLVGSMTDDFVLASSG